jgi:hypothetical protein
LEKNCPGTKHPLTGGVHVFNRDPKSKDWAGFDFKNKKETPLYQYLAMLRMSVEQSESGKQPIARCFGLDGVLHLRMVPENWFPEPNMHVVQWHASQVYNLLPDAMVRFVQTLKAHHYGFDYNVKCDCPSLLEEVEILGYFRGDILPQEELLPRSGWPSLIFGPPGNVIVFDIPNSMSAHRISRLGSLKRYGCDPIACRSGIYSLTCRHCVLQPNN